jgi:ankyrin repeat protein
VHLAAHFGHRTALRQLLLARCAADLARRDGVTALHLAAEAGHLEMVKMLLEAEGMG